MESPKITSIAMKTPTNSLDSIPSPQNGHAHRPSFKKLDINISIKKDSYKASSQFNKKNRKTLNLNLLESKDFFSTLGEIKEIRKKKKMTRHSSLIYASREKYIYENQQSIVLTKISRPQKENDHKLQIAENSFMNNNYKDENKSPLMRLLEKDEECKKSKLPSIFKREKISPFKQEKIMNDSIEIMEETKIIQEEKQTIFNEEEKNCEENLEMNIYCNQENKDDEKSGLEKRVYEWLESENINFSVVDKKAAYNEKLLIEGIIKIKMIRPKEKDEELKMSPMLKRRTEKGLVNSKMKLLRLCSIDNLTKVLNVNMESD